ncbi:MAG: ABC transporter ATP-binding protein [Alphaproteobacteria bacterium]|nr:ABC transporter ATP-binding protein [Alphaproteobacteria bacterium]
MTDISFAVESGQLFGLIGLNGAGKTTFIKALLGLRAPDSGTLQVFDESVAHFKTSRRLAFLPERFEPSWFLSGLEFLKFSASLYGRTLTTAECQKSAERLALDPGVLKKRVQTYSKGMRQKLGLLATILTGADLLVLDEPMSGLDPVARALVKEMILEAKSEGRTVFLSSHILADMDEICNGVAVLHDRTVQFVGKPGEFRALTKAVNLERAFLHFIEKKVAA